MDWRSEAGFLGTNASLLADLNLMAYILILLPLMAVGYFYARQKMFEPQHKFAMTTITVLNWVLIGFVMISSFTDSVTPGVPDDLSEDFILIPTIHAVIGIIAQLLATYLVARMWLENVLPDSLLVKNIKLYMRITLGLWITTALFGIALYFTWYSDSSASSGGDSPVVTEEPAEPGAGDDMPLSTEDPSETQEPAESATEAPADTPAATEEPTESDTDTPVTTEEPPETDSNTPTETEEPVEASDNGDTASPAETEEPADDTAPSATEEAAD